MYLPRRTQTSGDASGFGPLANYADAFLGCKLAVSLASLLLVIAARPIQADDAPSNSSEKPIFGMFFSDIPAEVAKTLELEQSQGVVVTGVLPGLSAAVAGVQQGDVLIALNRQPVASRKSLSKQLAAQPLGSTVTIGLIRDGKPLQVNSDVSSVPSEDVLAALMQSAEDGCAAAQLAVAETYWIGRGVPRDLHEGTRWCRKAAEQECGPAEVALGECYAYGRGVEKELDEALRWYRIAAERGEPRGMTKLGLHYYNGEGVKRDLTEAKRWLQAAAELNEAQAQNALGLIHYDPHEGIQPNLSYAFDMFSKSAKQDFFWAWVHLGRMYEDANFGNADPAKAFRCYQQAAKLGSAEAYSRIGDCFQTGRGVTRNYPKAVAAYRKAIEGGSSEGYSQLGYLYEHGYGVRQDIQEALKLYEAGAKKGDPTSMFNLASLHIGGKIPKDAQKARDLYEKVAQQDFLPLVIAAQRSLGLLYELGDGVTKDLAKAADYYLAAARAGDAESQFRLGNMIFSGMHYKQDHATALQWFQKAADQGHARAQFAVGNMYERGLALPQDRTEAIAWYLKARDAGDDMAAQRLKELNP